MFKTKILEICQQRLREVDGGSYGHGILGEEVLRKANESNIAEKEMIYKIFERLLDEEPIINEMQEEKENVNK